MWWPFEPNSQQNDFLGVNYIIGPLSRRQDMRCCLWIVQRGQHLNGNCHLHGLGTALHVTVCRNMCVGLEISWSFWLVKKDLEWGPSAGRSKNICIVFQLVLQFSMGAILDSAFNSFNYLNSFYNWKAYSVSLSCNSDSALIPFIYMYIVRASLL